jgi:hypothetical protein
MRNKVCFSGILIAAAAVLLLSSGCKTQDGELAAYFQDLPTDPCARFMTDRAAAEETRGLLNDLVSGTAERRKEARKELKQLQELIEFGCSWQLPQLELVPAPMTVKPVIDGKITDDEWKQTIEIQGSCRAGRKRRHFDGSRVLFKYSRDMLYIAAQLPIPENSKGERIADKEDHILIYFDTPGGAGLRYKECIISPGKRGLAAVINWTYCGNGQREQLSAAPGDPEIRAVCGRSKYSYTLEMAIPRTLLRLNKRGCARLGLLFWDSSLQDYRTPLPLPYHGHDIYNRIHLRLPKN